MTRDLRLKTALRESRTKRVMGWRQTTSGRTDSAKRSLKGKGEMQKK